MTDFTATPANSAAAFVNSIGINADATDPLTAQTIANELQYLGIGHLRTDYAPASDVLIAGSLGAKVDEIVPHYMYAVTTTDIQNFLSQNIDPAASVIEAVEGPNEVQNDPDSYNGVSGPAGIEAMQQELYTLTKADTTLNNASHTTSVFDFSVLQGTAEGTYSGMQSYADFGNVHAYAGSGIPAIWMLPYETTHNDIAGSDPIVVTETGATTISSSPGVPEDMQARWDIEALLDDYNLGVSRTYLYNLTDWNTEPGQSGNFSAYYGLYNADGTPKLAATAIHNMTSLLSSGGSAPTGATLSYSLDGMASYGQSELFAKANGVFDIALWNDAYYWNATTATETALTANTVTLTFATAYGRIDVYDPLVGTSPVQSATNASSIAVSLGKDPLFIEVTPASTLTPTPVTPTPTPTPTPSPTNAASSLVVFVAEDAWQGDAQFTISLDGQQVGGVQTATASHALGASQAIAVDASSLGAGVHKLAITFLNDAYGGTASTDRNLYVTDATLNGQNIPDSAATLDSDGTATVGFALNAASQLSTSTLVLNVSEDAWQGDAEFTVLVDGQQFGGVYTATASHSAGQTEAITITGIPEAFAPHDIAVSFINDAYGGTPATDRNLYIGSATLNGQAVAGASASLYSNSTVHFIATAPALS